MKFVFASVLALSMLGVTAASAAHVGIHVGGIGIGIGGHHHHHHRHCVRWSRHHPGMCRQWGW